MNTSDSIQPHHLQRRAAVYVRQSSPGQVLKNQESTRLQYALRQRAIERGWHERDLLVIDKDLGITGSTAVDRPGFQELVALVSLGQIGIVFAYDATRLARNCTDWYQLLDMCGLRQCLVGDQDGIYDPATPNGRLILGLKGLIAELELHTLRARLLAGTIAKAERGELAIPLPAGLVRVKETGAVILEPDREVQQRLKLVFQTMLEKKSLPKVVRHFRQHDLKVPRRDKWGGTYWKQATLSVISEVVHNPAYAGAYVWGRTRWVKSKKTGRKQQLSLPRDQWRVCLHDRLPAYVSWNVFERIEAMLKDNHAEYKRYQTRGVPREGKALLQGIVYCGECGHKMSLQYKHGAQYLCNFRKLQEAQTLCQRLPGDAVDDQVVRWFFEALSVAEIDLSARVLAEGDRARDQVLAARRQEVERLRYQARLADRQFQRSDPDNRLVTGELERRWEESLRACQEAEERLREEEAHAPCLAIPADLLEQLKDLGPRLPELWEQKLLKTSQKKALLRTLIDKVVLQRTDTDKVGVRVVWRGGADTTAEVRVPVASFTRLADFEEILEMIGRLTREGQPDGQIAATLNAHGHRTPGLGQFNARTVENLRLTQRMIRCPKKSRPRRKAGYLTLSQVADKLNVPATKIYCRILKGQIDVKIGERPKCYLFPDKPETLRQIRQLLNGEIETLVF
jgi:DNA invertase Pin-like site-specific DNA recombinase